MLYIKWKERKQKTRKQEHGKAKERHDSQEGSQFSKATEEILKNLLQVLSYQGLSQKPMKTYLDHMPMSMSE